MKSAELPNDSARLILALGRQRARMTKSWQRLAVELAIKAIYEYETGCKMQWARQIKVTRY